MTTTSLSSVQEEIWQTIQAVNRAWTTDHQPEKLNDYFHENMIAITPTDKERREGREACVAGWTAFAKMTTVHFFKEIDPSIDVYGNEQFAVVTYYFDMSFTVHGSSVAMTMGGRDMFSL